MSLEGHFLIRAQIGQGSMLLIKLTHDFIFTRIDGIDLTFVSEF